MTILVKRFSTMLPVELKGEAGFHKEINEDLQRGPQRDISNGRGIEASTDDQEHAQPAPRERRGCRNLVRAYTAK